MNDYFLVTSNKPVYVNTVTTKRPYNECSQWTSEEWEELHLKYNEKFLSFDKDNAGILRMYNLDTSCLDIISNMKNGFTKTNN